MTTVDPGRAGVATAIVTTGTAVMSEGRAMALDALLSITPSAIAAAHA